MVICPDCGEEVPDAKFCKNCGASLPQKKENVEVEDNVSDVVEVPITDETSNEEDISVNTKENIKFCHNCGYKLDGTFKFCPNCGYDLVNKKSVSNDNYYVQASSEKSMVLAVILSVIFPGLGHFYLGLGRKGAIFLLGYIVSAILIFLLIGFVLCMILWIWALVDVVQSTTALNSGESVEDKLF